MQSPDEYDDEEVPPDVIARAKAAFNHRITGDIAVLVSDSLVDDGEPPANHTLRFEHPDVQIALHVSAGDRGSALSGTVSPPTTASVELQADGVEASLVTGVERGSFEFGCVPHGLMRLHLTSARVRLHTDWFRV